MPNGMRVSVVRTHAAIWPAFVLVKPKGARLSASAGMAAVSAVSGMKGSAETTEDVHRAKASSLAGLRCIVATEKNSRLWMCVEGRRGRRRLQGGVDILKTSLRCRERCTGVSVM